VLISNSQLVPKWATWEHFDELEKKGLMMYGQMTAGSWIYIGSQGIVQGTYETYAAIADKHFSQKSGVGSQESVTPISDLRSQGSLKGTLNVSAGLGGMGGAQPLAITMNEGVALIAEVEEERIDKRIHTKYWMRNIQILIEAIDKAIEAKVKGEAKSIGIKCNAVHLLERLIERNIIPDTLTTRPRHMIPDRLLAA
jgi:urocanate hydratase